MKPQLQPYLLETGYRGLEVLVLGGASENSRLLDEQAASFGFRMTTESFARDATELIDDVQPDVLLIDNDDEQNSQQTLNVLREVRRNFPALKAVLFAGEGGIEFSVNAVQHGARGLIIGRQAAAAEMAACIRRVHAGRICIPNEVLVEVLNAFSNVVPMAEEPDRIAALLSPREQEVRALVVQGMTNREIAARIRVTENTVKKYVYEVFNKTGASSRVELVLQALQSPAA